MKEIIKDKSGRVIKVREVGFEPSKTQPQFKEQCDINHIIKKYKQTGELPHMKLGGKYGDFTSGNDYQEAMQKVVDAQNAFMTLPANVRSEFKNDPAELLSFLADPNNIDKAVELGLVEKKQTLIDNNQTVPDPVKKD